MKEYKIEQFTAEKWNEKSEEYEYKNNVVYVVEHEDKVCMDIEAEGIRIKPILKKLAASLKQNGFDDLSVWVQNWYDQLNDDFEKDYFIWSYDGFNDMDNGVWSYSWGLDDHEGSWYIFLNVAK